MINLKNSIFKLVKNAKININCLKTEDAIKIHYDKMNIFADIRDIREISKDGLILGYKNVPSVILEFWIAIKGQYQKKFLNESFNFTLYCASDWRSTLATLIANIISLLNTPNQKGVYNRWLELNNLIEEAR